jgi:hypothetical protein
MSPLGTPSTRKSWIVRPKASACAFMTYAVS